MTEAFAIRFITEEDGRPLRWTYLRPGMPKGGSVYDRTPDSVHVGVFADGLLIGSASFLLEDQSGGTTPGIWRLRGMITHPDWRGRTIGGQALTFGIDALIRRGATLIWCNGRTTALSFYRRHGFHAVGQEFETPGTGPHYRLVRNLPGAIFEGSDDAIRPESALAGEPPTPQVGASEEPR